MRHHFYLIAASALLICCGLLATLYFSEKLVDRHYHQVDSRMTVAEIESILGPPSISEDFGDSNVMVKIAHADGTFTESRKVAEKAWLGLNWEVKVPILEDGSVASVWFRSAPVTLLQRCRNAIFPPPAPWHYLAPASVPLPDKSK